MCGIAGILQNEQPVDQAILQRMTAALAHRGPDRQGTAVPGSRRAHVGFGHARLRIIDLSDAADQPMCNEDQSVWLVFNGEIYNY